MNPEQLLHQPTLQRKTIHDVGETEAQASQQPGSIRIAKQAIAKRQPFPARLLRFVAMHELGEIDLKLMVVSRRVRTLHFAELALKAGVHDRASLARSDARHVAFILAVKQ